MIVAQPTWLVAALTVYSVINSLVLTGLLVRFGCKMSFRNVFKHIALKTVASVCVVIFFFYFVSKMFCWTAWLMQCVECVCLSTSLGSMSAQSISDQILFTFAVTVAQLCLLRIPPLMSRLTFCACVSASNILSMLAIIVLALVWPL